MASNPLLPVPNNTPFRQRAIVEEGGDYVFKGDNKPPYDHFDYLGHGGSGTVDAVRDINTGIVYARKTIKLRGSKQHKAIRKQAFDNEIKIIRNLGTHHHIIRVFATYYEEPKLCLIMQPVADGGDLDEFIHTFRDDTSKGDTRVYESKANVLKRAFGCLASGLAFIHRKRIRHKDINGKNILVHQHSVVYTDFGLSKSFSEAENSSTDGPVQALTRRYSAPEILDHDRRNSKSDVFSLGCVYLELLSALTNVPTINYDKLFAEDLQNLATQVQTSTLSEENSNLATLALSMVAVHHDNRPRSFEVDVELRTYSGYFCNECHTFGTTDPGPALSFPDNGHLSRHTTFTSDAELQGSDDHDDPHATRTEASPDDAPRSMQASTERLGAWSESTRIGSGASPSDTDLSSSNLMSGDGSMDVVDGQRSNPWRYSEAHSDWYYATMDSDTNGI